jgi:hypothetical protein
MSTYVIWLMVIGVVGYIAWEFGRAICATTTACTRCGGHHPLSQCSWPLVDE